MFMPVAATIALTLGQVKSPPAASELFQADLQGTPLSRIALAAAQAATQAAQDSPPSPTDSAGKVNGNDNNKGQEKLGFVRGVLKAYKDAFFPDPNPPEEPEPKRR